MKIPFDYRDLLSIFNENGVRYLIIGAYAVIYYTEPRYTKDFDVWIDPTKENANKVYAALKQFGAPLEGITTKDFTKKSLVYQMGVAPVRIDVMMGVGKISFADAWQRRVKTTIDGVRANIVDLRCLMKLKTGTSRQGDKIDLKNLKGISNKKRKKR